MFRAIIDRFKFYLSKAKLKVQCSHFCPTCEYYDLCRYDYPEEL